MLDLFDIKLSEKEKNILLIPSIIALILGGYSAAYGKMNEVFYYFCALLLSPCVSGFVISTAWSFNLYKKYIKYKLLIAGMSCTDIQILEQGAKDVINGKTDSGYALKSIRMTDKI